MANEDIAWLAGLLEGDGSFELAKNGPNTVAPTLRVAMLDQDIVERVSVLFGNTPVYTYNTPKGDKTMYRTQISKQAILQPILESILPYLGIRRKEQANEMINTFILRGSNGLG